MVGLDLVQVGQLQVLLAKVQAAVRVTPHRRGSRDETSRVGVNAPALAPLTVQRHLALGEERKIILLHITQKMSNVHIVG